MKNDTDGDLDWDHVDPDPMQHQLNGYFVQKMGELQLLTTLLLINNL